MAQKSKNPTTTIIRKVSHTFVDAMKTSAGFASNISKAAKNIAIEKVAAVKMKEIIGVAHKVTDSMDIKKASKKISALSNKKNILKTGEIISNMASIENVKSAAKFASGVKGYNEIKEAKEIKEIAEAKINDAMEATEDRREKLNQKIEEYAKIKISTINLTVCVFIEYLKKIEQKYKGRGYDVLKSIDIKAEDVAEMEDLSISSINLAKGAVGSAAIGTIALFGTKAAVVSGVTALASASTGTAISSLSGAAATNAVLAFLGGGSLASGGGGIAAGAIVLGGITAGAFASVGALTGGILLSAHGSKALTRAKKYSAEVDKAVATLNKSWVAMDGIMERVKELKGLTLQLEKRAVDELDRFKPFVDDFDIKNKRHLEMFQKSALLVTSIGEIANTSILDENGDVSIGSKIVAKKARFVLKT